MQEIKELEAEKFEYLKDECEDMISNLFYYNRKECNVVSVEDMDKLSKNQIEELCEHIKECMSR